METTVTLETRADGTGGIVARERWKSFARAREEREARARELAAVQSLQAHGRGHACRTEARRRQKDLELAQACAETEELRKANLMAVMTAAARNPRLVQLLQKATREVRACTD